MPEPLGLAGGANRAHGGSRVAGSGLLAAEAGLAALASRLRGRSWADRPAYALSEAANHSILWHSINVVDLSVALLTGDPLRRRRALRRSTVLAVEQALVNGPVKSAVRRTRPLPELEHPHRLRTPLTTSFPSGHATAGACAAELLARDLGHRGRWWALALAVGWSRVHVGVHHPGDVLAGWLVGVLTAGAAQRLWPPPGPGRDL